MLFLDLFLYIKLLIEDDDENWTNPDEYLND